MKRFYLVFSVCCMAAVSASAANTNAMLAPSQYNMMEPYLNQNLRQKLKPTDAQYTTSSNQAAVRKTSADNVALSNFSNTAEIKTPARRVVQRKTSSARSAVTSPASSQARKVVSRSVRSRSAVKAEPIAMTAERIQAQAGIMTTGDVSPSQCLARYNECMDNYCHRPSTKYDRCYCSAKLAQIDAQYKPAIDDLLNQIAILKNGGPIEDGMTQEEINEYWNEVFGSTGENSMANLDGALNIDWSSTESSVRGQNAFVAGDTYCKQQLTYCYYMAENLKSMYRTNIGQDCKVYETYLIKLKTAAEQIVDN